MNNELLTTKEAALYLDMKYKTLNDSRVRERLKGRKSPPHYKKGRFVFYKKKDLDAWLENKKPTAIKLW